MKKLLIYGMSLLLVTGFETAHASAPTVLPMHNGASSWGGHPWAEVFALTVPCVGVGLLLAWKFAKKSPWFNSWFGKKQDPRPGPGPVTAIILKPEESLDDVLPKVPISFLAKLDANGGSSVKGKDKDKSEKEYGDEQETKAITSLMGNGTESPSNITSQNNNVNSGANSVEVPLITLQFSSQPQAPTDISPANPQVPKKEQRAQGTVDDGRGLGEEAETKKSLDVDPDGASTPPEKVVRGIGGHVPVGTESPAVLANPQKLGHWDKLCVHWSGKWKEHYEQRGTADFLRHQYVENEFCKAARIYSMQEAPAVTTHDRLIANGKKMFADIMMRKSDMSDVDQKDVADLMVYFYTLALQQKKHAVDHLTVKIAGSKQDLEILSTWLYKSLGYNADKNEVALDQIGLKGLLPFDRVTWSWFKLGNSTIPESETHVLSLQFGVKSSVSSNWISSFVPQIISLVPGFNKPKYNYLSCNESDIPPFIKEWFADIVDSYYENSSEVHNCAQGASREGVGYMYHLVGEILSALQLTDGRRKPCGLFLENLKKMYGEKYLTLRKGNEALFGFDELLTSSR